MQQRRGQKGIILTEKVMENELSQLQMKEKEQRGRDKILHWMTYRLGRVQNEHRKININDHKSVQCDSVTFS